MQPNFIYIPLKFYCVALDRIHPRTRGCDWDKLILRSETCWPPDLRSLIWCLRVLSARTAHLALLGGPLRASCPHLGGWGFSGLQGFYYAFRLSFTSLVTALSAQLWPWRLSGITSALGLEVTCSRMVGGMSHAVHRRVMAVAAILNGQPFKVRLPDRETAVCLPPLWNHAPDCSGHIVPHKQGCN